MIRTAIIGISGFGRTHFNDQIAAHERGDARLIGATVINQDEEAERCATLRELGCKLFTDYREMLAELGAQLDVCCIPTGIHLHAPMAIDVMRAGVNAFIEKPAAATIQDVLAMQAAEAETGKFVAVGYQTIYSAIILEIKQTILDGAIGAVRGIKAYQLTPRNDVYYARNVWAGQLRLPDDTWVLDSPINNACSHTLNNICFLAGDTLHTTGEFASVQAELYRANNITSADTACLRIQSARGFPLHFYVTHCGIAQEGPRVIITGETGRIEWHSGSAEVICGNTKQPILPRKTEHPNLPEHAALRRRIMAAVFAKAKGEDAFVCDLNIAGTHTRVVNAAHISSAVSKIPPEACEHVTDADGVSRMAVAGMDDWIRTAFAEEKLLSEMDIPWAQVGACIDPRELSEFTNCAAANP